MDNFTKSVFRNSDFTSLVLRSSEFTSAAATYSPDVGFVLVDQENCLVLAPDGSYFKEPSCVYPLLEYFYFPFEKYHLGADGRQLYDYLPVKEYLESHIFLPVLAVSMYAGLIYFGRKFMASRKPYNLRNAMAAWNLFLSLYSMLTVLHGFPIIKLVLSRSLHENLCESPEKSFGGSACVWTILFVLSKFAELFDTFFIIAHKKPLIFLHWYHHITVLLFCWVAFQQKTPSTIFFGPMNALVHSIMYGYYFLMTMKMKPKFFNAIWITVCQIAQMIIGTTVSALSLYYYVTDETCANQKESLIASFFMYGSYLYLFSTFFYQRYFKGNKNAKFAGEQVAKKYL